RDLFHIVSALHDMGDASPALRALEFLARRQRPDGAWDQNFRLDGKAHWTGIELDEVAYPILLAWRLSTTGVLEEDPWPDLVKPAAKFLITNGPLTPLDRWEDAGGLSPATLAAAIAALVAAAEFADDAGEHPDGSPWRPGVGQGRPWPLLTAERAHRELALKQPIAELVSALEAFAGPELMLPEQVWDADDIPARELRNGRATGSVAPLGW